MAAFSRTLGGFVFFPRIGSDIRIGKFEYKEHKPAEAGL